MVQNANVISTLLKESPRPIFLLGAGASVTSGIPLAAEIVNKAAKWAYARQHSKDVDDPRITRSDWYPWLKQNHAWFKENVPLATLFPYAVENLLIPQKIRKEFWVKTLNPDVRPSNGYIRLVELMHLKRINIVLTTNFDECILKARNQINRPHHIDTVRTPSEYNKISSTPTYPLLVFLHGDVNNYSDKNVIDEVANMDKNLVKRLVPILKDHPLVIIGYRGFEPSVMQHLLLDNLEEVEGFKNGIYWCLLKGEKIDELPEYVKELRTKAKNNFQFLEIENFDHVFDRVIWSGLEEQKTKIEVSPSHLSSSETESGKLSFDLKSFKLFEKQDFDEPLLKARLEKYSDRLNLVMQSSDPKEALLSQMEFLNLIRRDNKVEIFTTYAGAILFYKNPSELIKSVKTKIRFSGPSQWLQRILNDTALKETSFERDVSGNIWHQLEVITDALSVVNKPFRLKGIESQDVLPYEPIALKEIVVNALVHRDFEIDEPILIEIAPDSITITNPGGLIDEVKTYFEDGDMYEEILKGRRGIKAYRNPVLADLFYGSGAMDKRGSGLFDVVTLVNQNSGHVEFYPNLANSHFTVKIKSRPEAVDELTFTAKPLSVTTTTFSSNIIPFQTIPERIYFAETSYSDIKEIFKDYKDIVFPTFEIYNKKIATLTNLQGRKNTLKNVIDKGTVESWAIDEFILSPEGEKRMIKLLNFSVKSHLQSLGLIVDTSKMRAYFPRTDKGEFAITYQARFKKATRTVVTPRFSVNKEKVKYWEHKAFYYAVKKFGNDYGLFIEPTYVFTLDGKRELLAPNRVGRLATKKASRDYNQHVLNDLIFWIWCLGKGSHEYFTLYCPTEDAGDKIVLSTKYLGSTLNFVELIDLIDALDETDPELEDELTELADLQREGKLDQDEFGN